MRLLNTTSYELDPGEKSADSTKYAILSHRWEGAEVDFQTAKNGGLQDPTKNTPSHTKLRSACDKAKEKGCEWLWADTCCIDKNDPRVVTESINSMFEWYSKAKVCFAYLKDVSDSGPDLRKQDGQFSGWFGRGWTLQELLAPTAMEFYNKNWGSLGTRGDLADTLNQATRIQKDYLTGSRSFREASIAAKMSWMAGRQTERPEDIAYSMLGIFSVNMEPQYGEGKKAFMRLQRALMMESSDESLFAWTMPEKGNKNWGMVAPSPDCFLDSSDVVVITDKVVQRLEGGYNWVQQGVQFQVSFKAGTEYTNLLGMPRKEVEFPLNCWRRNASGAPETVVLQLVKNNNGYQRGQCNKLKVKRNAKPSGNSSLGINQVLTKPFVVTQPNLDTY
ncbi:hypothetical protein MMC24_001534 [Lignoscripta atroalba]|nr:hypothetical protein [Lignoscripta atroalba]